MVSPFTQGNRYTFMGTCEHILLESCPPQQSDFVVSADFITDSMDNGAIGVFMVSVQCNNNIILLSYRGYMLF